MLLAFGCTRAQELFFNAELLALADAIPKLDVRIAIMERQRPGLRQGTALAALSANDFCAGSICHLCGLPAMIDAAQALLRQYGISFRAIQAERFALGV